MDKDKMFMEASWWRDWLCGKLGLVLMDEAVLSRIVDSEEENEEKVKDFLAYPGHGGQET